MEKFLKKHQLIIFVTLVLSLIVLIALLDTLGVIIFGVFILSIMVLDAVVGTVMEDHNKKKK